MRRPEAVSQYVDTTDVYNINSLKRDLITVHFRLIPSYSVHSVNHADWICD